LSNEKEVKNNPLIFFKEEEDFKNKIPTLETENPLKKITPNDPHKNTRMVKNTTQIDMLKNLDETTIKNLDLEEAKKYIGILKNIIIKHYKENNNLKKEKFQNMIHQPPTSKEEKLHSPLLFSQNKNNK